MDNILAIYGVHEKDSQFKNKKDYVFAESSGCFLDR